jgi:Arc/MetJ family transcription regulator
MKTTIEISDSLLDEAKRLAAKEGTTVSAYVEQGLRRIVAERESRGLFRLRKATFKGKGLQPGVQDATWERIRETNYQGRGNDRRRYQFARLRSSRGLAVRSLD